MFCNKTHDQGVDPNNPSRLKIRRNQGGLSDPPLAAPNPLFLERFVFRNRDLEGPKPYFVPAACGAPSNKRFAPNLGISKSPHPENKGGVDKGGSWGQDS